MDIAGEREPDYESARVESIGFADPYEIEGAVTLRSENGKEFSMRSFSGEAAKYIACVADEGCREEERTGALPMVYNMISQICDENELVLVKAKIYQSGGAVRASIYLTGKKDIVLKNYRASDAIALAALYRIPILVRKNLLVDPEGEEMHGYDRASSSLSPSV